MWREREIFSKMLGAALLRSLRTTESLIRSPLPSLQTDVGSSDRGSEFRSIRVLSRAKAPHLAMGEGNVGGRSCHSAFLCRAQVRRAQSRKAGTSPVMDPVMDNWMFCPGWPPDFGRPQGAAPTGNANVLRLFAITAAGDLINSELRAQNSEIRISL